MTPSGSLSDRVRSSCAEVVQTASLVRLVPAGLDRLAEQIADDLGEATPISERPINFDEPNAMRSLAANAINFGSGYHDIVRKDPGLSGARTMFARLMRYIDATGPMDTIRLERITLEDASQIFGQELEGGAVEQLMSRFATALNDLGSFVRQHGGSARSVLEQCNNSAVTLARLLTEMPYYRDVEHYNDLPVSFYKRAQITPADLARQGLWEFSDLSELTAFADNLVPHVLRLDGAIEVEPDSVHSIDRGDRLAPGSALEVELRAAAVVSVEELVARVDDPAVWAMHIDEWLWKRGGGATYKAVRRPRSRSVFY